MSLLLFFPVAVIVLAAVLSAWLVREPVPLTNPQAEKLIAAALPNYRMEKGELSLEWSFSRRGAGIAIDDLMMTVKDGSSLKISKLLLYPSWLSLIRGKFELSGLLLRNGELRLKSLNLPDDPDDRKEIDFLRIENLKLTLPHEGREHLLFIKRLNIAESGQNRKGEGVAELRLDCGNNLFLTASAEIELTGESTEILLAPGMPKPLSPCPGDYALGWEKPLTLEINGNIAAPVFVKARGKEITVGAKLLPEKLSLDELELTIEFAEGLKRLRAVSNGLELNAVAEHKNGRTAVELRMANVPFARLPELWSPELAKNGRRWILANIRKGLIPELTARMELADFFTSPQIITASGKMDFTELEVNYLEPMTPLTQGAGSAVFTEERMDVTLKKGRVGGLEIEEGSLSLLALDKPQEMAEVKAAVSGEAGEILALLSLPPVRADEYLGPLFARKIKGKIRGNLEMAFPLLAELPVEKVKLQAGGRGNLLTIEGLTKSPLFINRAELRATMKTLKMSGEAQTGSSRLEFSFADDFKVKKIKLEGSLVAVDAEGLGLPRTPGNTAGPVQLNAVWNEDEKGLVSASFKADLKRAEAELPFLGLTKPAGEAAELSGSLERQSDGRTEAELTLIQGGGKAKALLNLGENGKRLLGMELTAAAIAENDFTLSLQSENRVKLITMEGNSWNASELFSQIRAGGASLFEDFDLSLNLAKLKLFAGHVNKVGGKMERREDSWSRAKVDAEINGHPIVFRITPEENDRGGRRYLLRMQNLGEFLRNQGITERLIGGRLEFFGVAASVAHPISGNLSIQAMQVGDFPFFARLLNLASLSGARNLLGRPVKFDDSSALITIEEETIDIAEGVAKGDEMVLTFSGAVDTEKDLVKIKGALIPSYLINSALEKVPILGELVTGGQGGVIAVDYRIEGDLDDPKVSSNPFSAVTPGLLKKILPGF